jgi:hypothetical protein
MTGWFRVFGRSPVEPQPAALLEHLQATGKFRGDDLGWFHADLVTEDGPIELDRFLASEDGIRAELRTWAAWLETREGHPNHGPLMERMIATQQVFTLHGPAEACEACCRYLAGVTDGVYQVDGRGIVAADGTLLLEEEEN